MELPEADPQTNGAIAILIGRSSSPSRFRSVAHLLKLGDNTVPVISLDLDPPLLDRSSRAQPVLQLGGKLGDPEDRCG